MRNLIEKNLYLNDFVRGIAMCRYNKKVKNFINKTSVIDSICNYKEFKNCIDNFSKVYNGGIFSTKRAFSESLLYGHINELFAYGNLPEKDFLYFPIMEHGIQFYMQTKRNYPPRIFQGDYFLDAWRKEYPGNPYYTIGPYIHYARPYYSEEKTEKLKKEFGKTLLVFPSHAYELCESKYDASQFVSYVMDRLAKDYSTVMVCAYWADLDDDIYNLFRARGAKIISAGFRGDLNFIRRLRTIIELSDCVVANALGTFLGYAVYLDKPVIMIDGNVINDIQDMSVSTQMEDLLRSTEKQFMIAFSPDNQNDKQKQSTLCEPYWGFKNIKTPDEIKAIYEVNKKVIKRSRGNIRKMGSAAKKIYENSKSSDIQRKVLKEALGK